MEVNNLGNNMEKIFLGVAFTIGGVLYFLNLPIISKVDEFSYTLSAFFLSISSLFTEPLNKGKTTFFSSTKHFFYLISFLCIILLPQFENIEFLVNIANSINYNAFLMFGLGISFFSMFFNDKDTKQLQKKLELEKHEAVLNERKKITEEFYRKFNRDNK